MRSRRLGVHLGGGHRAVHGALVDVVLDGLGARGRQLREAVHVWAERLVLANSQTFL